MTASFSKSSLMPPMGWHSCSRYRGEHSSSVLGSLSKPTGMGRPDDQGRGRESRERPVLMLTGPRGVWVWGLGAGRSALTTHTHRPFPGGPAQQLRMHKGPLDARLALDLNGVQFAGIHYRLVLTRCLPLEKRLNGTVGANTS